VIDDTNKGKDNSILGHGSAVNNQGLHLGERGEGPYFVSPWCLPTVL
jgi:hypothetical protein